MNAYYTNTHLRPTPNLIIHQATKTGRRAASVKWPLLNKFGRADQSHLDRLWGDAAISRPYITLVFFYRQFGEDQSIKGYVNFSPRPEITRTSAQLCRRFHLGFVAPTSGRAGWFQDRGIFYLFFLSLSWYFLLFSNTIFLFLFF